MARTLRDQFYFGRKKTICSLQANDPEGYALFHTAITTRRTEEILRWAEYVIS